MIAKHRKVLVAAVAAVLALVLDSETAQQLAAAVGVGLVYLVPNE